MNLRLEKSVLKNNQHITITGSKSESNRLLLLQALYPKLSIKNISNSDDSQLMQKALQSNEAIIDINHAGTAMRFLTAYFASNNTNASITLTGSNRMQERPIKVLVDALNSLGASISYVKHEGYPPIKITGKQLVKNTVSIKANISSQYISALILIGSKFKNGFTINLQGQITSVPYIKMTLNLLNQIGIQTSFNNNTITIVSAKQPIEQKTLIVESDWSSASYFYSLIALSDIGAAITLSSYKQNSLQGDSVLASIYEQFGVKTSFSSHNITLQKTSKPTANAAFNYDLANAPDIAQTIAVTCLGLNIPCHITGLHTLKIKETDRLQALKNEIEKFGTEVIITKDSLRINKIKNLNQHVAINTYHDHRMAMAFAPLALKQEFTINDAQVVSKSYPDFWHDLNSVGIKTTSN